MKIRAFILSAAIFLNGCVPVKNPWPNQIEGTWEHISLLYVRMELDKNAEGWLVSSDQEGKLNVFEVRGFISYESNFSIDVRDVDDPEGEVKKTNGTIYTNGKLCLDMLNAEELIPFCFMKLTDIQVSRIKVFNELEKLNNKKRNELEGFDESSIH